MNRPLAALAGACALALALSACSTTNPDAATVNGVHLNRTTFEADLHSIATNPDLEKADLAAKAQGGQSIIGDAKGTVSSGYAQQQLSNLILLELIHTEISAKKIVADADQISQGESVAKGILGISDEATWASLPANLKTKYAAKGTEYLALSKSFSPTTDAELTKLYESVKDQLPLCASHILVATEDEANTVVAELKSGKDFAEIAKARSIDPGSKDTGGSLLDPQSAQCPTGASLVPEFAAAAMAAQVGVPTAPVKTQFGYHIIRMDKAFPTVTELKDQLITYGGQEGMKNYVSKATGNATVSVDPHYGMWDSAKGSVVPTAAAGTTKAGSTVPTSNTDLGTIPAGGTETSSTSTP